MGQISSLEAPIRQVGGAGAAADDFDVEELREEDLGCCGGGGVGFFILPMPFSKCVNLSLSGDMIQICQDTCNSNGLSYLATHTKSKFISQFILSDLVLYDQLVHPCQALRC